MPTISNSARKTRDLLAEAKRLMLADAARSGLNEKDCARLCFEPILPTGFATTPRYRIWYHDLDGNPTDYYRDRFLGDKLPTDARGKEQRYKGPAGKSPRFHLPPYVRWRRVAADPSVTVYITEGEKKAARVCKTGQPCIGLGGVWNWRHDREPIADFDLFDWRGRRVVIVFDSDAATNPNIQRAEFLLAAELKRRGAVVSVKRLPSDEDQKPRRIA